MKQTNIDQIMQGNGSIHNGLTNKFLKPTNRRIENKFTLILWEFE